MRATGVTPIQESKFLKLWIRLSQMSKAPISYTLIYNILMEYIHIDLND
jgi:hypothetical protein